MTYVLWLFLAVYALIVGMCVLQLIFLFVEDWIVRARRRRHVFTLPPERRITDREETPEGEQVTLECGHKILIRRNRIFSLPCNECRETRRKA